ncbi:MAG TPA: PHP domain-containing protein [Firmicutes bacterium]|nr:PHP domain-containing protein [Bacillota bacterium]
MVTDWADLHVHTTASDGVYSPEEAVEKAIEKGLSAIAIADHDNVSGIQPAMRKAAALRSIVVVPAVELSCEWHSLDIHILGYFIDVGSPGMVDFFNALLNARLRRLRKMVSRLAALGVPITEQEVLAQAGAGAVGRPHLARILVQKGFAQTEGEAFSVFLERGRPAYVERYKLTPENAIRKVSEWGGVPFLAHPGLGPVPEPYIRQLVLAGLRGLEVKHPSHSSDQVAFYTELARQLGLLLSGGSDTHGPEGEWSNDVGDVKVPMEWVRSIEAARRSRGETRGSQD